MWFLKFQARSEAWQAWHSICLAGGMQQYDRGGECRGLKRTRVGDSWWTGSGGSGPL